MFEDVGKKIKGVAKGWFALQCVAAFVSGLVLVIEDEDMVGAMLLIWVLGPILAWLSSLMLYGFGEIVDTAIINRKEEVVDPAQVASVVPVSKGAAVDKWLNNKPADAAKNSAIIPVGADIPEGAKWCAICGTIYGPDAEYCEKDGRHLVRY